MQLYAVTIEVTGQTTIILAASSLVEAEAAAIDRFDFGKSSCDLSIVEAEAIEEAANEG